MTRILQYQGTSIQWDNEYLQERNEEAITDLWNSALTVLTSDPVVASYIHELKFERPINQETPDPKEPPGSERFQRLYQRMCADLPSIPESVRAVPPSSSRRYLLLAQEIQNISLERAWVKMRVALRNPTNLPAEDARAEEIRTWLNDSANAPALAAVKQLDLSRRNLLVVPTEINRFSSIELLDLSDNGIRILSSNQFSGLGELKKLSLFSNHITNLPLDCFQGLEELKALFLDFNQISELTPGCFRGLGELEVLTLARNQIVHLASEFLQGLRGLENLTLDRNPSLKMGLNCFECLVNLHSLTLNRNQIAKMSDDDFLDWCGLGPEVVLFIDP